MNETLLLLFEPNRHVDHRGFFAETYSRQKYLEEGIDVEFVQDNHSLSREVGTLRGLHFQSPPHAQAKLVRCGHGAIFDVVIIEDICRTFQQAVTWKFWEVRDTRTLFDLADISVRIEGKHNALTDAVAQSKAVQQAYAKLKV